VLIRYTVTLLLLVALAMETSGCLHRSTAQAHAVEFNGVLVDGQTNQPISGLQVEVRSGDHVVYNGETDGEGAIHFTHTFIDNHPEPISGGEATPVKGLTVVFHVDAGDYGVLEIPVRLIHGSDEGSLGQLRLVPKEGP
jgi:hypothetical protein